jgi:hypothetical protein
MTKIPNTPTYSLLDIKQATLLRFKNAKNKELSGINNAGNTKYAASILPNAVGFGNTTASVLPRNLGIIMEGVGVTF